MKKTKKKLRRLQFFSWVFLFAPILSVIGYNASNWFTWETGFLLPQGIELGIGMGMAAFSGVMLALGKTNLFKGSKAFLIVFVLSVFLYTILIDIIVISGALLLGSTIFESFKPAIADTKETYKFEKQANIQANAMQNVMLEMEQKSLVRSGRI